MPVQAALAASAHSYTHQLHPSAISSNPQCPQATRITILVPNTPPRALERLPQPSGDPTTQSFINNVYASPVIPTTRPSLRVSPSPRISSDLNSLPVLAPIGASRPNPLQNLQISREKENFRNFHPYLQTRSASPPNPPITAHEPNTLLTTSNINSPPERKIP